MELRIANVRASAITVTGFGLEDSSSVLSLALLHDFVPLFEVVALFGSVFVCLVWYGRPIVFGSSVDLLYRDHVPVLARGPCGRLFNRHLYGAA